ncbi:Sden_1164 family protein [Kitasatospora cheerisanensis]|uniref:Sugar nucleotidyltransferases-like protein n=2 Tax=Kitasatospora TaxID=2063 RepID=A0A066YPL3_9ACTN|nr:Sden_1164 family protein [Kitasatospora cheerisanensis]AGZ94233.1 sugar nucleotidyltransferases-like protein [Kitasatospora sp. NRRL F-6133]KDN81924.1 sugar nucleotidyltransferases-like protein [Kitasatospora cheerisanensis KCTC 2395]
MIECVVVLAAGLNRRMGGPSGPKSLLPLRPGDADGPSFLSRNLELYRAHGVRRVVLVVNSEQRRTFERFAAEDVELVTVPTAAEPTGSSVSMAAGLAAVLRRFPAGVRVLVTDADVVYERAVLDRAAGLGRSALLTIDRVSGDGEEVRVYGRAEDEPVLIGKGLSSSLTAGLELLGESLGLIVLDGPEVRLAAEVVQWIVGDPPQVRPYGYGGRRSEHEEVWQYLFTLGRLPVARIDGNLLFSECDFPEDLAHIQQELYPAIRERDEPAAVLR